MLNLSKFLAKCFGGGAFLKPLKKLASQIKLFSHALLFTLILFSKYTFAIFELDKENNKYQF
ncbi:hypothetical protein CGEO_0152 [Campylobacter geochelonis]|nr:hypothetical protein CGEO_0152 [Campylobacter geochelonis]